MLFPLEVFVLAETDEFIVRELLVEYVPVLTEVDVRFFFDAENSVGLELIDEFAVFAEKLLIKFGGATKAYATQLPLVDLQNWYKRLIHTKFKLSPVKNRPTVNVDPEPIAKGYNNKVCTKQHKLTR